MTSVTVQLLYFEGCPHHRPALDLTRAVLRELGVPAEIEELEVRDDADAERLRFLGSPSIRVNGLDIEPGLEERDQFGLACRTYGTSGVPSRELLVNALTGASARGR